MPQATWIPDPLVRSLEAFKAAPPNEFVKVTAELSPPSADVGEGAPISVKGKVTVFGLGVPMPVLILMARRPAETLAPVALAFSLPFSGGFSADLDTTGWEYGQYAFQAVALPLAGSPSWSATMLKSVAEPRVGVSVAMSLVGAQSPLALVSGAPGYADYTLTNSGNVGIKNIRRLAFFQAGVGGTRWPADGNPISDTVVLAGGASRRYDNHAVPSAGMAEASYDAVVYVEYNIDHVKLPGLYAADDRKMNELTIATVPVISATIGPGMMWWSGLANWIDYAPQSVPYGTSVYTAPTWVNQSTVPITGTVVLTVTKPSGATYTSGAILNQSKSADPGSGWAVQFNLMPMTDYGIYTIVADLYVDNVKRATTTYTLSMLEVVPVYTISITPYMKDSAANTYVTPDASGRYNLTAGRAYFTWADIVVTKTKGGVVQNDIDLAVVNSYAITGTPQGQPGAGTYYNRALGYPVNAMPSGATVQTTMTVTIAAGTGGSTGVFTYDVQTLDGVARRILTLPVVVV